MSLPYWLIAVPRSAGSHLDLEGAMNADAQVFRFECPSLRVGTLDKLMAAGDDLTKVDVTAEQLLRKVERAFGEVNLNDETLSVDGEAVPRFLQRFRWSSAKYPHQRPLDELTSLIKANLLKVEEELKETIAVYQDKKQAMNLMQRKRGGNLMVGDLRELLTSEVVSARDFVDTEYLSTLVVIVPKNSEQQFLKQYETLADDSVSYGPPHDRESVRGSPVVPRSAVKKFEDKDGYACYLVKVLKQYADAFSNAAREHRFTVRPFEFATPTEDGAEGVSSADAAAAVDVEYNAAVRGMQRWCKAHFGEVFSAWIHVKAMRTFVESPVSRIRRVVRVTTSGLDPTRRRARTPKAMLTRPPRDARVLRFGLPVDFMAALLLPKRKGQERRMRDKPVGLGTE